MVILSISLVALLLGGLFLAGLARYRENKAKEYFESHPEKGYRVFYYAPLGKYFVQYAEVHVGVLFKKGVFWTSLKEYSSPQEALLEYERICTEKSRVITPV